MFANDVFVSIADLAHRFGCERVAEGVEDDVLELLRDLGVDCARCFHLGRSAPS
jgi:EAL domain-containing protein (putative c-di-GMP-specific phosphodiesterase class I)